MRLTRLTKCRLQPEWRKIYSVLDRVSLDIVVTLFEMVDKVVTVDSTRWLTALVEQTRCLRADVLRQIASGPQCARWRALRKSFARQTGVQEESLFADAVAQAIACGLFALRAHPGHSTDSDVSQWLLQQADPIVKQVLSICFACERPVADAERPWTALDAVADCLSRDSIHAVAGTLLPDHAENEPVVYFYERFLQTYDGHTRRRRGVWYTPSSVARFVIHSVDNSLCTDFQLPAGLADTASWTEATQIAGIPKPCSPHQAALPFVRVLDPAMGTGAFLLAVVDLVHARVRQTLSRSNMPRSEQADAWDQFVEQHLLPRLHGMELMLPAVVLAHILLAQRLSATGYRFRNPARQHLVLADTLLRPPSHVDHRGKMSPCFTVVVGNPPFSGISANRQPWVGRLLRGMAPGDGQDVANYFSIAGKPIRERKHWLEDDYVKFIRLAHWMIESAGAGVVSLVTNHGFLDNSTFRAMRWQLLNTFPKMMLVDLHGNRRGGETGPNGRPDENVFSIEQGVVISLMCRPLHPVSHSKTKYAELWGKQREKIGQLSKTTACQAGARELSPRPPNYFLVPRDTSGDRQYEQGFRLPDIMPVCSTATVTARDPLVTGFQREELLKRLEQFRDLRIPDNEIRRRFFSKRRSGTYPAGDTRGWKLAVARRRLAVETDWQQLVRGCHYRPFDQRWIFWADWMIDWPRTDVMRHVMMPGNLALIARRQTPPSQSCTYFWVTDTIVLDGVIRSDNRGSESVFPLFLNQFQPDSAGGTDRGPSAVRANFSSDFIEDCGRRTGLRWLENAAGSRAGTFGPIDLLHYIYALFFAPSYRTRFADNLRIDFPRVFIPCNAALMWQLCKQGEKLVRTHLLRTMAESNERFVSGGSSTTVEREYPKHDGANLWINQTAHFSGISDNVWKFRVGTHQVCRKWLKDRLGRKLEQSEITRFGTIIQAIEETEAIMRQIDRHLADAGGWDHAFSGT